MVDNREPLVFSVGDTLAFSRYFRCYLPSNGWSLLYEIRSAENQVLPVIQFVSTPDALNVQHEISVLPAVTSQWQPGAAILAGYAVNLSGERHQIYDNGLNLTANLGDAQNNVDVSTHAQRMIPLIEAQLEALATNVLDMTNVQQVEIHRAKRMDLEKQLAWNKTLRQNELAQENVRNGRPSGERVVPQFNVIQSGCRGGIGFPFFPNG